MLHTPIQQRRIMFSWQFTGANSPPLRSQAYVGHTSAVRSILQGRGYPSTHFGYAQCKSLRAMLVLSEVVGVSLPSAQYANDIAHDNRRFVSCSHDLTVRWDVQSSHCLATMTEHTNWVHQALFLDERTVVSVAEDGKVCC